MCFIARVFFSLFLFFNDTATTEIYTLSLHDALPISTCSTAATISVRPRAAPSATDSMPRSEEHTSELQSLTNLVCRLLLEKKKKEDQQAERSRVFENVGGRRGHVGLIVCCKAHDEYI